jgi:hypothetical protein
LNSINRRSHHFHTMRRGFSHTAQQVLNGLHVPPQLGARRYALNAVLKALPRFTAVLFKPTLQLAVNDTLLAQLHKGARNFHRLGLRFLSKFPPPTRCVSHIVRPFEGAISEARERKTLRNVRGVIPPPAPQRDGSRGEVEVHLVREENPDTVKLHEPRNHFATSLRTPQVACQFLQLLGR